MYKSIVVGFDAREMWLDIDSQWTQDKKTSFLLRQNISKPLSVDSYIWYSVFSELLEPHLWHSIAMQAMYSEPDWNDIFSESRKISVPPRFYRPRRVWRNLASLRDHLHQSWGSGWKPCYLVAVVEVVKNEIDIEDEVDSEPIFPNIVDEEWRLLGYDVADYELISGLFEGQMEPDTALKLRNEWQNYLNEYHLFTEPQKAFDYIRIADRKYPSHMPYYVYALYGIEGKFPII